MTAIVGILNKRAVAIAADSAVTVTSGEKRKIYNTSQKIFRLSEKNPVAIMTYSNVEFMETPLDVIIDLYRSERGDKTFKKMQDYCDDFLEYLSKENGFMSEETQKDYFLKEMFRVYDNVTSTAKGQAAEQIDTEHITSEKKQKECYNKQVLDVLNDLTVLCQKDGKAENFKKYTYKSFIKFTEPYWDVFEKEVIEQSFPEGTKESFQKTFYEYITSEFFYYASGLVFIGYGSKDLYPSMHSIYVSGIFDDRLRYFVHAHDEISNDRRAVIQPFAQDDVIITMLKGIAPEFYNAIQEYHQSSLEKLKAKIVEKFRESEIPAEILEQVAGIDTEDIQRDYEGKMDKFVDDTYVNGIIDAVESFNIEDMASMAENLISITNLQRHFSSSEESVGGPVEVAVITRSGGFKWIKHKQL